MSSPSSASGGAAPREGLDVRLAIGAVVAWAALAWAIGWQPSAVLALAGVAATIGVLAVVGTYFGIRGCSALALAGFCVVITSLPLAARLQRAHDSPVTRLTRDRAAVTADVRLTGDPRLLAAKGPAGSPRVAVDVQLSAIRTATVGMRVAGAAVVLAPAPGWRDLLPGQRLRVEGRAQPPLDTAGLTVAVLSTNAPPQLLGRPPWWQRDAGRVRSSLQAAARGLPLLPGGLLPGLVDGDTSRLDPVLAQRFRVAGLTHLVAVSGTNCSILIGAVLLALKRARASPYLSAALGSAVLVAFVVVARPSPSVLRAAVMAAIALVALAAGRAKAAVPALSATVIVLLVWSPELARNAGFAMSVLATGALLTIAPAWATWLHHRRVPAGIAEALAVAAAAHVVTAPVIAAIAGSVSLVAIPANVLAEPAVVPATILGFLAAVVAPICLPLGTLLAQLAGWPCRWLVRVAEFFGGVNGANLPWPGGIAGGAALLGVIVLAWWLARRPRWRALLVAGAMVALAAQMPFRTLADGWPPPGWIFVACDVGQGDALALRAGPGSAVVVDAGPDPVLVDRCLSSLGIANVPLLVLTHLHLDHVGGIAGVLHGRTVGTVLTGPLGEPEPGRELLNAGLAEHGLIARIAPAAGTLVVGPIQLEVLGPVAAFHGSHSDPNNSSVIMRATVSGVRVLLPGDAEIDAQQALLDRGVDVAADVLKVPHHGSAYSVPTFLRAVHARVGVISVGANNDYGHPSPILLRELAVLGVPVRRTDQDGDVAVVSSERSLRTVVHPWRASAPVADGIRAASQARATMASCQPDRPSRPPAVLPLNAAEPRPPGWLCSSVMTNSSPPAPSSRSPPLRGPPIRRPT